MRATLADLLPEAQAGGRAIAGFNIFGLDEAYRVVSAAEKLRQPVILMTNRDLVRRIPVEVLGPALQSVAEHAAVPVCVHLDHTSEIGTAERALAAGYSSVMYDGSQLPFEENVAGTRHVVNLAHRNGISVEGEIGSVAYDEPGSTIKDEPTDPDTAARYVDATGVDAVAVSVGTIHKLVNTIAVIDHRLLKRIGDLVSTPLVIHGTSGVAETDLRMMAAGPVAKFNIGTLLRRAWGDSLRQSMLRYPESFDRLTLTSSALDRIQERAEYMISILASPGNKH